MNLQSLFFTLLKKGKIVPSRKYPIQSSLRRYAELLGYSDLASCPESEFNLPLQQRNQLIAERAQPAVDTSRKAAFTRSTLSNIKCDVSFVLKKAASLGLIRSRLEPEGLIPTAGYVIYKYPDARVQFRRSETNCLPRVALSEKSLPPLLRKGLDEYYQWSTGEFVLNRPRSRKRRPISANFDRELLRRVAGFHVKYCGSVEAELTLRSLLDEAITVKYVNWFISHHGRTTFTLKNILISLISLARYLVIVASDSQLREALLDAQRRLENIRDRLPDCVAVRDKKRLWLSLEQIELCGINRYPRNAARLAAASDDVRRKLQTLNTKGHHSNLKNTAVYALESLLIRLMVRIPLRLRNFCEMSWNPIRPGEGKNLYRKDGSWYIRFSGSELKVRMCQGRIKSIRHRVPSDLAWLLEEVLTVWRPIITGMPYSLPDEGEVGRVDYREPARTRAPEYKNAPDDVLLFLTAKCRPASRDAIRFWVESTSYAYTKIAVYPHLIRDIWATAYIKKTGDFAGAAKRLGNTVAITMKHYAHLLDDDAEAKGDDFNIATFGTHRGNKKPIKPSASRAESSTDISQKGKVTDRRKRLAKGVAPEEK